MSQPAAKDRILVALDTVDLKVAQDLVRVLAGEVGGFKIGKEFFTALGPEGVRTVLGSAPAFLDLKFHDIPNTVAGAIRAATKLGVRLVNVHASGGTAMMAAAAAAAREAASAAGTLPPKVLGVTVLTSMDESDLEAVGQRGPAAAQVERLARLSQEAGLDGVVCSPPRDCIFAASLRFGLSSGGARYPPTLGGQRRSEACHKPGGGLRPGRRLSGDRPPHHRRAGPA